MAIVSLFGCKTHQPVGGDTDASSISTTEPSAKTTMPEGRLNELSYSYQGMRMEMVGSPSLTRIADGKALLKFKFYADERSCEVADTLLDQARDIIEEEKMYEYDSSYSLSFEGRVLDGYSWSFDAVFENGGRIYSHGRHASPKGDGLNRIYRLMQSAAMQCLENEKDGEE